MADAAAARHYFDDLATQNDAVSSAFEGDVPTGRPMHPTWSAAANMVAAETISAPKCLHLNPCIMLQC